MNKYKKLASNTVLISIGTFASKLLVFLMVRFYTGYLNPADYGTADLLTQTANLLIPVFSLGITDGVFRFAIDREGLRKSAFTTGFGVITIGCVLLGFAIPLMNLVQSVRGYAWLIATFVAASCYHGLVAQFIRAEGKTALFAVQGLINTALVIGLNILFLAVFHLGITGYVLSVAVANLLCTIFLVCKEQLWRQWSGKPEHRLIREMFRYSIPLIPTTVFWWITSVSDRYMISGYLGADATGIYSVAYKIPTMLTILSGVFMEAWQLSAVQEAHGSRREHIRFYSKVWSAFQVVVFLCAASVIALSQPAIRLLADESYSAAWIYIPLLSISMVFAAFSTFMGSVYVVTKKSKLSFWTATVGATLNVVLNILLIPSPLGVHGAAIATFASYFVVFVIRVVSGRKLIPFRIYLRGLVMGTMILAVQTVFIVFMLPAWQAVQVVGIALLLFLGYRPLLDGASKIGLRGFAGHPNIISTEKGENK